MQALRNAQLNKKKLIHASKQPLAFCPITATAKCPVRSGVSVCPCKCRIGLRNRQIFYYIFRSLSLFFSDVKQTSSHVVHPIGISN